MKALSRHVVRHAQALAREIDARAILLLADAIESDDELRQLVRTVDFRTILIARESETLPAREPLPQLASGLGTRHAAAAITASTDAAAIVVSQSTGTVTVFKSGQMITDIHKPANGSRLMI